METRTKNVILSILFFSFIVALLTAGICNVPIDQILPGDRDLTKCYFSFSCFGVNDAFENTNRDYGAVLLIVLSTMVTLAYLIFKLIRKYSDPSSKNS